MDNFNLYHDECDCECHTNNGIMHCMPCCSPCEICGLNIKYYVGHRDRCMRVHRKVYFDGKFLRLVEQDNWQFVERTTPGHPVAILAIVDGEVIMVEQYRVPLGRRALELPSGLQDYGEDYLTTANRELEEETGYRAKSMVLRHLGQVSSGLTDEHIALIEAFDCEKVSEGGGVAIENEQITVRRIPLVGIPECFNLPEYENVAVDPKLFAALFFYYHGKRLIHAD